MLQSLQIQDLMQQVMSGRVRLPGFQRDFVWGTERRTMLLDSLYKGYPIGSLLFWRTEEKAPSRSHFGPYNIPEVEKGATVQYVLDGQQRMVTIYQALTGNVAEPDIFLDLGVEPHAQFCQFAALSDKTLHRPTGVGTVDYERFVPLRGMFDGDTFATTVARYKPGSRPHHAALQLFLAFSTVLIPVQILETPDHARVAMSFKRLNVQGAELDMLHVLQAISWSEDFDLNHRVRGLARDLTTGLTYQRDGSETVEPRFVNVVIQSFAGVVTGAVDVDALTTLKGDQLRKEFSAVEAAIRRAFEFLQKQLLVANIDALPYLHLLPPLACFFATAERTKKPMTAIKRNDLKRWFWSCLLIERFADANNADSRCAEDIAMMVATAGGGPRLARASIEVDPAFFLARYDPRTARSKTLILLLLQRKPLSWISGDPVDLGTSSIRQTELNRHHIYPKAHLRGFDVLDASADVLANIAIVSAEDNWRLTNRSPVDVLPEVPRHAKRRALVHDDVRDGRAGFDEFTAIRSEALVRYGLELTGQTTN